MKHYQVFSGQRSPVVPTDCNGEMNLMGNYGDYITVDGKPGERVVYLHICDRCQTLVSLARGHALDAELVPLAFELLNSYVPVAAKGLNGAPVVRNDMLR